MTGRVSGMVRTVDQSGLALGPMALDIEQVGSTAVPGLDAKPVIDIQVSVLDVHRELRLVPPGERVFAAVTPGNACSLRAFLAAGLDPIGSEILLRRN